MDNDAQKSGKAHWIVGGLLLIWGLLGITMYIFEMTMGEADYIEQYGQLAADIRHVIPSWSVAGYAIGVWTGLLGTVLLLMRKAWAVQAYIISIAGAALGWVWYVIDPRARALMNEQGGWIMMAVVFGLCAFSIWWARRQKARGILR